VCLTLSTLQKNDQVRMAGVSPGSDARSEKPEARSQKREARSEKREANPHFLLFSPSLYMYLIAGL
jgi:hypothetical protein